VQQATDPGEGLRRTEAAKLDVVDFGRNPKAPQFGRFGMLNVRYGKAKKGQPPRRRNVLSVMDWAVEAVADYVENVRPRFGFDAHPALWVTERGGRIKPAEINARFVVYRDALKLPKTLVPTRSGTRTSPTSPRTVLIGASSNLRSATSATVPRQSTPTSVTTT
jgi:hypothetical protein